MANSTIKWRLGSSVYRDIGRADILTLAALLGVLLVACGEPGVTDRDAAMPDKAIDEVVDKHAERWMAIPGVEGVGVSEQAGEPIILIMVSTDPNTLQDRLPQHQGGYRLVIRQTGRIEPRHH